VREPDLGSVYPWPLYIIELAEN